LKTSFLSSAHGCATWLLRAQHLEVIGGQDQVSEGRQVLSAGAGSSSTDPGMCCLFPTTTIKSVTKTGCWESMPIPGDRNSHVSSESPPRGSMLARTCKGVPRHVGARGGGIHGSTIGREGSWRVNGVVDVSVGELAIYILKIIS
jgi:hypothetical protein